MTDWTLADAKKAWQEFRGTWPLDNGYLRLLPSTAAAASLTTDHPSETPVTILNPIELERGVATKFDYGQWFACRAVLWRGQIVEQFSAWEAFNPDEN